MYSPPPRIEMLEPVLMETQIAETCMVEDDFSIAFMFSTIYLRLEGNVPPRLKICLNMNAIDSLAF